MLTVTEAAELSGLVEPAFKQKVTKGILPAPAQFVGPSREPRWSSRDLRAGVAKVTRDMQFGLLLDELRRWVWINGTAAVPLNAKGRVYAHGAPVQLGALVIALRTQKKAGAVPEEWVRRFEKVPGWTWDETLVPWHTRLDGIASRYPDKLKQEDREWLRQQHRLAGAAASGKNKLRREQRDRLKLYPVPAAGEPSLAVQDFVAAAQQWLEENPDHISIFSLPFNATVERRLRERNRLELSTRVGTYPLGRRATYFRRRYTGQEGGHPMPDADIDYIEANLPDWSWEMSDIHVRAKLGHRRNPLLRDPHTSRD